MRLTSSYPVLMNRDVAAATAFYRDAFGFEVTFESEWYVSLRHGAFELALLDPAHETCARRPAATTAHECRPTVQICARAVARLSSVSADGPARQTGQDAST